MTEQEQQEIRDKAKELQETMNLQPWKIGIHFVSSQEIAGRHSAESAACIEYMLASKTANIYLNEAETTREAIKHLKHEMSHIYSYRLDKYIYELLPEAAKDIFNELIEEITEDISNLLR